MSHLRIVILGLLVSCSALLGGCTQGNSGDDAASGAAAVPLGLDRFLLFPNPVVDAGGNFQTDTNAYAQAYYSAVDPLNERTILASWKSRNQFGMGGQEFVAVFRDVRDLGYGRRMTGRRNADGSIAFFVENYNVSNVPGGYSQINADAAVVRDPTWHVGTNAIEWSPAQCTLADPGNCNASVNFTKYFNFDPATGQRQNTLNLDGRGQKSIPGICVNCHGGRADPLTPQGTFALVENALSRKRGDVQARLQAFNVDSFEWATTPGFTRADQEAVLKIFNQWVLCSYPGGGSVTGTWGTCNRPAGGVNEWQGTEASNLLEAWYGGAGMPNPQFAELSAPPGSWGGDATLYNQVVAPYCRTCHILRGTANENDIDLTSEVKFRSYASRIKAHVFDRGNMPLAWLVYQDFWESNAPSILASYINSLALPNLTATDGTGAPLRPGRPIADPGPDRMVRRGADARLYGGDSLFATSFNWALDPPNPSAVITNSTASSATFFSNILGTYTVRLTVSSRGQTDSKTITVTVDDTFRDPATIKFAHVKDVLQNGSTCATSCHVLKAPTAVQNPPIWYTDLDRNSDTLTNATDDAWFYSELIGRVNLTELGASPLLRKPSDPVGPTGGNHHDGGTLFNLATTGGLSNFSVIYNWILNGAQSGGVVANFAATITNPVTFSGGTFTIPLSASTSIGATNYSWLVVPNTIPVHPNGTPLVATAPFITQPDPLLPGATLNVFDAGTYDVSLTVSNGIDVDQKTLTVDVQEAAVTANFTPHAGAAGTTADVSFNFPSSPSTASVTLNATTSGNPTSCLWEVSPSGPTLGTPNSCTSTTFVASTAQIGTTYTVTFTANNVTRQGVVSKGLTVQAAAGSNPTGADFTFGSPKIGWTVSGTPGGAQSIVMSGNQLNGSASGLPTLNFAWSATSSAVGGASGCSVTTPGQNAFLTTTSVGNCDVTLTVTNGFNPSSSRTRTVAVGALYTFAANVAPVFPAAFCTGCHVAPGTATTPDWTNNAGLYARIIAADVINTGRLLTCPSAGCNTMGGGHPGFTAGSTGNYDIFLTWINSGAPDN